ncbi:MAG: hypothetical protein KatS3mg001_150 [Candidatus Pacearchaeota archaeon]|nr:MAG: hypothetical protein KatS3mg001_150 [Candidatus Pacearchaeota archaeon]
MKKPNVFIADDEESLRRCLEIYLRREYPSIEVITFKDGDQLNSALQQYQENNTQYTQKKDVVITDYHMPGMCVENIIEKYHQTFYFVLCTSDYARGREISERYDILFIEKPFSLSQIKSTLDSFLDDQ